MSVSNIPIYSLASKYTGELLVRAASYSDFEEAKSFIDSHNMICFIEDRNIIYAMNHEYRGITTEQANSIAKVLSLEEIVNATNEKIRIINDGNSIIGELSYTPIYYTDNSKITEQNVTELIKSVCNMLEQGTSRLNVSVTEIQTGLTEIQSFLDGFSEEDTNLKEYINTQIDNLNSELQKILELQKISISGDNVHIEVEKDPQNQYGYIVKGKDIASNEALQSLSKQVSDIFGNVDKNIKDIVQEELESAFIPNDASDSLDSISKIAKWIQSHPDEYKDLYAQLNSIQETVGSMDEYATKGELYEPNGQLKTIRGGTNYATTLEEVNEILKDISFAKDVQDGAEANWLTGINIDEQSFTIKGQKVQFTSETGTQSDTAKFIKASHNSVTRILDFGIETKQLETIIDTSIDMSKNELQGYVESRLSWTVK